MLKLLTDVMLSSFSSAKLLLFMFYVTSLIGVLSFDYFVAKFVEVVFTEPALFWLVDNLIRFFFLGFILHGFLHALHVSCTKTWSSRY